MTFQYPWVLFLLVIPLGLAFWEWVREAHPLVLPFDHAHQHHGNWLRWLVNAANLLPALLLAVTVIILAGPLQYAPPEKERELTNILFCLDLSGSMNSAFGGPVSAGAKRQTRYEGAVFALKEFCSYRKGDAFGLTVFGNEYLHWMPVTKDTSALQSVTEFMNPSSMPRWFGGTQIGKALRGCRRMLQEKEEGDRMIILISDGMSSDLYGGQAQIIASELAEQDITVYMISVAGTQVPAPMYTIASVTGGDVFTAGDPEALSTVFRHIDQMQKAKIKRLEPVTIDYFKPFALAGLILLGVQVVVLFGIRYTPW